MAVPYEEFVQWQLSGVSNELKEDIKNVMADIAAELVNRERPDADRDQYLRGFMHGLRTLYEWKPTFITEDDNAD